MGPHRSNREPPDPFGADILASRIFGNAEHALLVRLGAVSLVLSATKDVFKRYYRVFVRMKTYSAFTIAESFGSTLLVAALVLTGYGVKGAILAGIILDGIVLGAASFGVIREIGFSWPKFKNAKTLVSFGLPYVPMAFSIWVAGVSDRYFLGAFRGAEEVGIYSVSYSLGYTLAMVVFNPIFLILPSIASRLWNEGKKEEVKELFQDTLQASIFIIAPLLVLAVLFSPQIVRLLTTSEFAQGAHNLPIVAFGYGFLMISGFGEIVLSLTKKTHVLPLLFGWSAAVNTVLNIFLIPPFGATGAATATAATYLLHLIVMVIVTSPLLPLAYHPQSLVKIVAASAAAFFLVFPWRPAALWQIAAASVAAFAVYVSATVILKLPTFSILRILLSAIIPHSTSPPPLEGEAEGGS
ncbi:MAG: oligosaccharide flippase family protein [Armatimonadetes bacterium]|nr:oligosaccharide flippase family protein [Armatimonadota bacterium]